MTGRLRFTDHVIEKGLDLFAALEAKQLEGMVAKRADSLYVSGRSKDWLKVKTRVGIEQMQRRIESWGHRRLLYFLRKPYKIHTSFSCVAEAQRSALSMMATTFKAKIPQTHSYPVGAEDIVRWLSLGKVQDLN